MTRTGARVMAALLLAAAAALWLRRGTTWMRGERWYAIVYRTFYKFGLRVWERRTPPSRLVDLVEGPNALPPGRALDLGCGTGTDSIYLAQHGWNVIGVDMVPEALALARRRAMSAGVGPTFVDGDVTRVQDLVAERSFQLILDFGCFHTLPADVRDTYVRSVTAVAAPSAVFLLYGFARPPRFAPMRAGLTAVEVRERFPIAGWDILSAERVDDPILVATSRVDRSFELWRYELRRRVPA